MAAWENQNEKLPKRLQNFPCSADILFWVDPNYAFMKAENTGLNIIRIM